MRTLKITLAYDGTNYVGWQRQAEGTSIQGLLEETIARIEGHEVTVIGAGRTDAGVHALAQVASVRVSSTHECEVYVRALNATLPADIRVRQVEPEPDDFHARYGARRKTYHYRVLHAPVGSPFESRYAWHVTWPLDLDAMRAALAQCVGRHDFAAFQGSGSDVRETVRTIEEATVSVAAGSLGAEILLFSLTGDGFLRHMVRNIVGTVIDIGRGRWGTEELGRMLASRDRTQAGPTAPPQGLFLVCVGYQ